MRWKGKSNILHFLRHTRGAVAVEFALISTVFILLLGGVFDFGHAYYMKQVITNASREGARYGVTYKSNAVNVRIAPNAFSPSIDTYIKTKYLASGGLPSDANPKVTLGGAGLTTGTKGSPVEVTVTATKTWFLVSGLIPGLGNHKTLTAKTVMLCE
jgi:Flp pilus assembly protein TadG